MGKTKKLNDGSIPVIASVDDDALVSVVNAETGAVCSVPFATLKRLLVDAVASSGKVFRKVILPDVDTDANSLTEDMTVYSFISDRPRDITLSNFPPFSSGGMSLSVIREGAYLRQTFRSYGSGDIFVRYQIYTNSGTVWSEWEKISPAQNGGGNLHAINKLHTTFYERRLAA